MNLNYSEVAKSLYQDAYRIEEESFTKFSFDQLNKIGKEDAEIIVLINSSLQEKGKEFLEKVLQAVNIVLSNALIITIPIIKPTYKQLENEFSFKKLIALGFYPSDLKLKFAEEQYKLFSFQDKKLLFANDISILLADTNKKKLLWNELKKMFDLK